MKPLEQSRAGRLLRVLAEVVFRHPRWFCYGQLLLVFLAVGCAMFGLRFSTDRNDLISVKEAYRHRFLEFKREFRIHDNLFVLVESENREKNREFVERLAARLREDKLFGAVYYRGELNLMGPKALLFLPEETLVELRSALHTNQPLFHTFSQASNLESLFALVNRQFRLAGTSSSTGSGPSGLSRAIPMLQRIVDSAAEAIEFQKTPVAPDIAALAGSGPAENPHQLYLNFDHGRVFGLIAQPANANQETIAIRQLRNCIVQTRSEVPGLNVEVTGEAVLRHDEMQQARTDTEAAAAIALALTALIFVISCRDLAGPLMATVCLVIGICYTLGFAALKVGRFNILSITLVPILIGLAIDYGVHLLFRYEEEMSQGLSRRLAIHRAVGFTGLGVVTSALAIAGAFYFMVFTDFQGIREMGLIAASGVILCLVPMFTLLPLFLVRGKPDVSELWTKRRKHTPRAALITSLQCPGEDERSALSKRTRRVRLERLFLQNPWSALACGGLFTAFAVVQSSKTQFDYNLLNLQSRGLPAVRMQKQMIRSGAHSLLYCAVIADSLPQAVEWERRIGQLPSVGRVLSLVKYLTEDQERKLAAIHGIKQELEGIRLAEFDPRPVNLLKLNQALFSLSGYLGRAIESMEPQETNRASADLLRSLRDAVNDLRRLTADELPVATTRLTAFQQALFGELQQTVVRMRQQEDDERLQAEDVPVFIRDFFVSASGKFLLQVYPREDVWQRDSQERFIRDLRTVDSQVTGAPVQFYEYTSRLKENVQNAALYALGAVSLLVFVHFRRLSSTLLAVLPVLLGSCWMVGLMGWLNIPFNPVNIVSLILVVGIGVTNGVHILNRFAEEPQPNILSRSTGKAVLVSALNTMVGFGSLLVAKHQGIASLGAVMAIGTATCSLAALALLPAVLTLLCRIGWCPAEAPKRTA